MKASIPENLDFVRRHISLYEQKYDRSNSPVRLVAVSKGQTSESILEAFDAGQGDFGENYLREAQRKISKLHNLDITWHFIGPIQSNKTRGIAEHFDWVHSVDRISIARRLSDQRPRSLAPLNIMLQVNIDGERSKFGVSPDDLESLAAATANLPGLILAGLMAIPAPAEDFSEQRKPFRLLREARDRLREQGFASCRELSMGMSRDFEAAIAEGATMVRIGTSIFGDRK